MSAAASAAAGAVADNSPEYKSNNNSHIGKPLPIPRLVIRESGKILTQPDIIPFIHTYISNEKYGIDRPIGYYGAWLPRLFDITTKAGVTEMLNEKKREFKNISELFEAGHLCTGLTPGFIAAAFFESDIALVARDNLSQNIIGIAAIDIKEEIMDIKLICSNRYYGNAGRWLMTYILIYAKKLGMTHITLASVKKPKIQNFYKSFHMRRTGSNGSLVKYKRRLRSKSATRKNTSKN